MQFAHTSTSGESAHEPAHADTSRDVVLGFEGVEKTYAGARQDIQALAPIDLTVADGELVCVLGPSGCGKTTLLKIAAGLLTPSRGRVSVRGNEVRASARQIGVVFQEPVLLPWRSVLSNVLIPAEVLRLPRKAARERALDLLRIVGLEGFEQQRPAELSGGMQQRVSMARALVHDPALVLMDEPFGALDAMTREQMQLELLRIWTRLRKTILMITHSVSEAILLSDRVVVMSPRPGRIADVLTIDLPRPRTLDLVNTEAFGAYVQTARTHLKSSIA